MTHRLWRWTTAFTLSALCMSCGSTSSDVRQTAFHPSGGAVRSASFDTDAAWLCGDADLEAVFSPSFTGDALTAAVRSAIADPRKQEATFSFVAPIESFFTDFNDRALCMRIDGPVDSADAVSLVAQLRSSGKVTAVRAHS